MAELKLPFVFTPGMPYAPDQVQTNFDFIRQLVQDLNDRVAAFDDLVVSGTFTNTNKLVTDSSGNVNQVSQPNFLAHYTGLPNINITDENPLSIGSEVYDQGNNYNPATSTFTAPKTGKYLLCLMLNVENGAAAPAGAILQIITSNRTYTTTNVPVSSGATNDSETMAVVCIADMDINDTANGRLARFGGAGTLTDSDIIFSGSLLN